MKSLEVATGLSLATDANGMAIDLSTADFPFQPGGGVVAVLNADALADCTLKLQGSNDNASWSDLASMNATQAPSRAVNVTLPRYIRYAVDEGSSGAGTGSIYLLAN